MSSGSNTILYSHQTEEILHHSGREHRNKRWWHWSWHPHSSLPSHRFLLFSLSNTFFPLVERIWKDNIFSSFLSHATHSLSNTQFFTVEGITYNYSSPSMTSYLLQCSNQIWIFLSLIFAVTTKDLDCSIIQFMNLHSSLSITRVTYLCSLTIIFIFTSEIHILETVQHFTNTLCWLG